MKTNRSFFFLLTFLLFSLTNFSQNDISSFGYPDLESVVNHFYENYQPSSSSTYVFFEKRPEGYFVAKSDQFPYQNRDHREMLWSIKTKAFQKLKLYRPSSGNMYIENMKQRSLMPYIKYDSKVCIFYNYPGWQRDIINQFGNKKSLPDTLQYGLSRAYSTLVGNLMSGQYGNVDSTMLFNLPKGKNAISPSQLSTYRKYINLSKKNFYKLYQQNPEFETKVGKIYTKYCNEIMWDFLMLHYFQNEEEARKVLQPNLYNDFYINAAKNLLNSCPPNSILLTYGDNDTYPLFYVQAQLGFRTDVLIANLSLINVDRYIDHLRGNVFNANPLVLPFDSTFYQGSKNNQLFLNPHKKDSDEISINEFWEFILDPSNTLKNVSATIPIFYSPTEKFYLNISKEKIIQNNVVPSNRYDEIVDTIHWTSKTSYLLKGDLIQLGMISESDWDRPICIAMTCRKENFLGMNDYFHLEGMAYRLLPIKSKEYPHYLHGGINAEECYKKLTEDFNWEGVEKIESGMQVYYQNYTILFQETINQLLADAKHEKAEKLLKLYFKTFPNEAKPYEGLILIFVNQYFQLGKNKKAENIALQIIDNFSKKESLSDRDYAAIRQLNSIASEYNNEVLRKAIEKSDW